MIVVHERRADATRLSSDPNCLRHILERRVALIPQQMNSVAQAYDQIRVAIVVKISRRATQPASAQHQLRRLRDVSEVSAADVVQQLTGSIGCGANEKEIGLAIAVIVEKARTGAGTRQLRRTGCARTRLTRACGKKWLLLEIHRNCRRCRDGRAMRKFRQRIASLIAISSPKRSSQMVRRNLLKPRQMFPRRLQVALCAGTHARSRIPPKHEREKRPTPCRIPRWLRHIAAAATACSRQNSVHRLRVRAR